jgi:hypothetical protein
VSVFVSLCQKLLPKRLVYLLTGLRTVAQFLRMELLVEQDIKSENHDFGPVQVILIQIWKEIPQSAVNAVNAVCSTVSH